jgi:hypothetical protein
MRILVRKISQNREEADEVGAPVGLRNRQLADRFGPPVRPLRDGSRVLDERGDDVGAQVRPGQVVGEMLGEASCPASHVDQVVRRREARLHEERAQDLANCVEMAADRRRHRPLVGEFALETFDVCGVGERRHPPRG